MPAIEPKTNLILSSSPTFMQGEPILLSGTLQNPSDRVMLSDFGRTEDKWFSLTLVDADDKSATPKRVLDSEALGGYRGGGSFSSTLSPKEKRPFTIVATRYFDIPHPGKWTLTMRVQMPVLAVPPEDSNKIVQVSERNKLSKLSSVEEFTFPLEVLPVRVAYLRDVAEKIRKEIGKESDYSRRKMLILSLLSMPEREVWRVWEELGQDPPKGSVSDVSIAIGRVPSKHTAEILANMHWKPGAELKQWYSRFGYGYSTPGIALFRMRQQVDGELKEYIDSLFRINQNSPYPIRLPSD